MFSGELNTTVSLLVKGRGKTYLLSRNRLRGVSGIIMNRERLNDLRIQCTIRDLDKRNNRLLVVRGRIIHKHARNKMDTSKNISKALCSLKYSAHAEVLSF